MAGTAEKEKTAGKASSNGHKPDDDERARAAKAALDTEVGEEDDGQTLFVLEGGRQVTLGTLVKRGTSILYEFKMDGKAVKGRDMSLIPFDDPDMVLVVPVRAGKVETDPTYNDDGTVKHVTVRAHVKPKTVYDARSQAARAVLGE
jgi:hypothetical protein